MPARGHRTQSAVQHHPTAVVCRPDVPPRAPAKRPLSSVSPDRRGSAGLQRPGHRRRADPDDRRPVAAPGPGPLPQAAPEHPGLQRRARRASSGADCLSGAAQGRAGRRRPAPPVQQPAARAGQQNPVDAGHLRQRPAPDRPPGRGQPPSLRRLARHAASGGH